MADFGLIGVELCSVDVTVSHIQCLQTGLDALVWWGAIDAKAEARDALGVGKGEGIGDAIDRHDVYYLLDEELGKESRR